MRRASDIPIQYLQQLSDGTFIGDVVIHTLHPQKVISTLLVGTEDATTVGSVSIRVLHVVKSVTVGLPHVDRRSLDRFPVRRFDRAVNQHRFTDDTFGPDRRPVLQDVGVVVKRSQDRRFGGDARPCLRRIDRVHESGDAEDVGQQDHLLPVWCTELSCLNSVKVVACCSVL